MALTTCPECKKEVSTEAKVCPHCGYPLKTEPGKAIFKIAERWGLQTQSIKRTCDIINAETGELITSAKMGDMATVPVDRKLRVKLHLHGYFGEPEITLFPGKTVMINVSISANGTIYCQSSDSEKGDSQTVVENKGGCYIATCVYGSYDCPQVWTLRRYRDYRLAKTRIGRNFIRFYYFVSPKLVKRFGNKAWFRRFWIKFLNKKVAKLQNKGVEATPYDDIAWN